MISQQLDSTMTEPKQTNSEENIMNIQIKKRIYKSIAKVQPLHTKSWNRAGGALKGDDNELKSDDNALKALKSDGNALKGHWVM